MKRFRAVFASVLAAGALALGGLVPASPAAASPKAALDVTRLAAPNVVVADSTCKSVPITMTKKSRNAEVWSVDVRISQSGRRLASAFYNYEGAQKTKRVRICPKKIAMGKVTLGPSRVYGYAWDYSSSVERTDRTQGWFYMRSKARTQLRITRGGDVVRFSATAQRYSPGKYAYTAYNPKAKIQVKSGKSWKTVKTVQLKRGSASATVKSKAKRTYRVTFGQISWATGATSKSIKR